MQKDADKKNNQTTDFLYDLEKNARDRGFMVLDNPGRGDCMFYALSEQLGLVKGITLSAQELRKNMVQYLKEHPKLVNINMVAAGRTPIIMEQMRMLVENFELNPFKETILGVLRLFVTTRRYPKILTIIKTDSAQHSSNEFKNLLPKQSALYVNILNTV